MPPAVLAHTRLLLIRDHSIELVDGLTPRVPLQELLADELGERDVAHDGEAARLHHLRGLLFIDELGEATLDTSAMALLTPVPLDLLHGVQGGPVLLEFFVLSHQRGIVYGCPAFSQIRAGNPSRKPSSGTSNCRHLSTA